MKKEPTMLIFNPNFSVCPVTTHVPLNKVSKILSKKKIINDVININNFYKKKIRIKPKIAILGLNPHCETIQKISEEDTIINGDEIIKLPDGSLTTMYHYMKNSETKIEEVLTNAKFENADI